MVSLFRSRKPRPDPLKGALAGLAAGLVASWVMERFQYAVPQETFADLLDEDDEQKDDDEGEQSEPGTVKAASAVSESVLGHQLEENEKDLAGQAAHYAMGGGSAMLYGVAAEFAPAIAKDGGFAFGTAVWLLADEALVPAIGLSEAPWKHPISTHAYSLSSHLVYGLTTELVRGLVRRLL